MLIYPQNKFKHPIFFLQLDEKFYLCRERRGNKISHAPRAPRQKIACVPRICACVRRGRIFFCGNLPEAHGLEVWPGTNHHHHSFPVSRHPGGVYVSPCGGRSGWTGPATVPWSPPPPPTPRPPLCCLRRLLGPFGFVLGSTSRGPGKVQVRNPASDPVALNDAKVHNG